MAHLDKNKNQNLPGGQPPRPPTLLPIGGLPKKRHEVFFSHTKFQYIKSAMEIMDLIKHFNLRCEGSVILPSENARFL